jgi:hypothetical protein
LASEPAFGVPLARNRPSDLSVIAKVSSATKELIFELDACPMNKQMRLKYAPRTALSLCATLF